MNSRQTQTATEWRVTINNGRWGQRIEWRQTRESAEALRAKHDVVSIELATRTLDW